MSSFHRLGVAVKGFQNNSSFQFGRAISTSLRLPSHSYQSQKRYYCYYTNPYLPQILRKGDRVVVGPSTYPLYEGIRESGVIDSLDTYYIQLAASLSNQFNAEDEVTGIGSALATGWNLGGRNGQPFYPGNIWQPKGIVYPLDAPYATLLQKELAFGVSDRYRQYLRWTTGDGYGYSANQPYITRSYGDVLLGGTTYRFGVFVKGWGYAYSKALVNDGISNFMLDIPLVSASILVWTEKTAIGTCSEGPTDCSITIYATDSASNATLLIDDIYLEHAKYTDADTSGVYTFTETPDFDSERVEKVAETEAILMRMPSGRGFMYQESGTGDKVDKYRISMSFSNVSGTFFANIKKLQEWQRYGNFLILHPTAALAAQSKYVLYCVMAITDLRWESWDRTRPSFTLIFEEI